MPDDLLSALEEHARDDRRGWDKDVALLARLLALSLLVAERLHADTQPAPLPDTTNPPG